MPGEAGRNGRDLSLLCRCELIEGRRDPDQASPEHLLEQG